jgi:biotin operon repressor
MAAAVKDDRKRRVHEYLVRHGGRAVRAEELSRALGIKGRTRDTRTRPVRETVQQLRDDGIRICADQHPTKGGYWLARNASEWNEYREACKKGLRFAFARDRWRQEKVTDRMSGQGTLFE